MTSAPVDRKDPAGPPLISAVMPCLNEARTLGLCIRKAQAAFAAMGVSGEVIVADNGSTDDSRSIAASLGAIVVAVNRKGYGAALMGGFESARGRYIVMADADDSYDWSAIDSFVAALEAGAEFVVGNRFKGGIGPGAMPPLHRYFGNPVLSTLARWIHRAPVGDFHCGMRAFRRDVLSRLGLVTPGMEFATEMIVNAVQAGLRIHEVPTTLVKDGRDRSPHLRSFRDGWRHLRFILLYAPDLMFFVPGAAMFLAGLVTVLVLANGPVTFFGQYVGIHFLALGGVLLLVGFNLIAFGVLAKVIGRCFQTPAVSRVVGWVTRAYALEGGVALGGMLILIGIAIDVRILAIWVSSPGTAMESSIHPGFVATLMIVLGINLVCASFLLVLLRTEIDDVRQRQKLGSTVRTPSA